MTAKIPKRVRCAVYTRVSTEYGLDQEFNSLDAQHDAAEAYIRSQAHDGWTLLRTRYDDGGYSGGSTDRPALQRLLEDIRAGKIDIIVVYKVDRLTRSLADFAKLVELFDAHRVSFVSVTQQFNTTTSMGRLTLNVLLSFAQFEREVTGERIRDKIAASKRKGIWVGGNVPLGYESRDKKLVIHEDEAERVRTIFRRYLELGSIGQLLSDLRDQRIVTKTRARSNGRTIGGIPFTRGPLAYLLRNRFYVGEVVYQGQVYPGEHLALLDRDLFEAVQRRLGEQRASHVTERASSAALLLGRIFDDRGNRMTPSHCRKVGTKYRYYTSAALTQGQPELAGSISRVPAPEIEAVIGAALRRHLGDDTVEDTRELIRAHVVRVEVRPAELAITLDADVRGVTAPNPGAGQRLGSDGESSPINDADEAKSPAILIVPWSKPPAKRGREIIAPDQGRGDTSRPIRAESRARLVAAIARGRLWLSQIESGAVGGITEIALRENRSPRHVNMTISLAFLAPSLVKAAVEGRLPRGIGLARLIDAPAEWGRQYRMLGLTL
jgi:DNA invertase Pin-like site-specific DNA recombinase